VENLAHILLDADPICWQDILNSGWLEQLGLVEKVGPQSAARWRATAKLQNMLPILNAALQGNLVSAELADESEVGI
jgi:hypothetical protein